MTGVGRVSRAGSVHLKPMGPRDLGAAGREIANLKLMGLRDLGAVANLKLMGSRSKKRNREPEAYAWKQQGEKLRT